MKTKIALPDESFSVKMATQLAHCLVSPATLTFRGEIGAGKTTLIRALLRALGVKSAIKSPTFSLIESYQCQGLQIHHFDLYRIQDESELEYIGFREYFQNDTICCIEWPERAPHSLKQIDVQFIFTLCGDGRLVELQAFTPVGKTMLSCLKDSS